MHYDNQLPMAHTYTYIHTYIHTHSGTYIGTSMNAEWTLVAKDLKFDSLEVQTSDLLFFQLFS